jgi:hypothetical protein
MKNNFKKFKKIPFVFSIIFIATTVTVFIFTYHATYNNVAESSNLEQAWQEEESHREEIETLKRILSSFPSDIENFGLHFIKSSDVVPVLNLVEELGPKVEAEAEVVGVDVPKDSSSLTVSIKASGSFEALYKFLRLLENSPYEVEIQSLSMQSEGATEENPVPKWGATYKVKLLSFLP